MNMNNRNLPYNCIKDKSKITRNIIIHEHKYTWNAEYFILESGGHTHVHYVLSSLCRHDRGVVFWVTRSKLGEEACSFMFLCHSASHHDRGSVLSNQVQTWWRGLQFMFLCYSVTMTGAVFWVTRSKLGEEVYSLCSFVTLSPWRAVFWVTRSNLGEEVYSLCSFVTLSLWQGQHSE